MSNIFMQPGLGEMLQGQQEFYSRRQKERLNRDLLRAQAEQYRAKAQQLADPRYQQSQMPAGVREYEYYQGLSPEQQKQYIGVKRATPEEALMRRGALVDPQTGVAYAMPGLGQALGQVGAAEVQAMTPAEAARAAEIERSKMAATVQEGAAQELGQTEATAQDLLSLLEEIETHPGMSAVIGTPELAKGRIPFLGNIPGTPAADFQTLYDRLEGQKFKQAYETLKGGGQITEIESEKAIAALASMSTAQSEKAFLKGLNEFKAIVKRALERAQIKAGKKPGALKIDTAAKEPSASQADAVIDYTEYFK